MSQTSPVCGLLLGTLPYQMQVCAERDLFAKQREHASAVFVGSRTKAFFAAHENVIRDWPSELAKSFLSTRFCPQGPKTSKTQSHRQRFVVMSFIKGLRRNQRVMEAQGRLCVDMASKPTPSCCEVDCPPACPVCLVALAGLAATQ